MKVDPIFFITAGVDVQVKFRNDEDEFAYFDGVISHINFISTDADGSIVNCCIAYDDGETVPDATLHSKDFENTESDDTWKFKSPMSLLIKYMIETNNELDELKENMYTESESSSSAYSSSDDEADSVEEEKVDITNRLANLSKFLLNMSLTSLFAAWTWKVVYDAKST